MNIERVTVDRAICPPRAWAWLKEQLKIHDNRPVFYLMSPSKLLTEWVEQVRLEDPDAFKRRGCPECGAIHYNPVKTCWSCSIRKTTDKIFLDSSPAT